MLLSLIIVPQGVRQRLKVDMADLRAVNLLKHRRQDRPDLPQFKAGQRRLEIPQFKPRENVLLEPLGVLGENVVLRRAEPLQPVLRGKFAPVPKKNPVDQGRDVGPYPLPDVLARRPDDALILRIQKLVPVHVAALGQRVQRRTVAHRRLTADALSDESVGFDQGGDALFIIFLLLSFKRSLCIFATCLLSDMCLTILSSQFAT